MKVLCNLTWECTLGDCKYCWIYGRDGVGEGFVNKQSSEELTKEQWVEGLNRIPSNSSIDFCGGEPTILGSRLVYIIEGLHPSIYRWGLTSNLSEDRNVDVLEELHRKCGLSCISLNCSYHHGVPLEDWIPRYMVVKELFGGWTRVNLIDNPFFDYSEALKVFRDLGFKVNFEPYQNPKDSNNYSPVLWKCTAGVSHMVISPNGDVYRCLCGFRSDRREEFKTGNILGEVDFLPPRDRCDLNCDPIEAKCWNIVRVEKRREQ